MSYRILVCPDSFKGSLSSSQAAAAIANGIRGILPRARIDVLPLADGGEGTLDVLRLKTGRLINRTVSGPLGGRVRAPILVMPDGTALIEMAKAAGLTLVPERSRNPLKASTYGVGQLMQAALAAKCRKLVVTLGGSATVDGGTGMAQALGARLLDSRGDPIPLGGGGLCRLARIDLTATRRILGKAGVLGATDVTNPLLGPRGAARVFGPQKGASPAMVRELERGLANLARVSLRDTGMKVGVMPGAGAAGGLGAGLIVFAAGSLVSGAEWVLRRLSFAAALRKADLLVTGEGKLDGQTGMGKLIGVVANLARKSNVPAIAFAGRVALDRARILRLGLRAAYPLADSRTGIRYAMRNAGNLLETRVAETFRKAFREGILPGVPPGGPPGVPRSGPRGGASVRPRR